MQPEAWTTANTILTAPDASLEPKVFAAQTFRSKVRRPHRHRADRQIIYDISELSLEHRMGLRDSLLAALQAAPSRMLARQIGLALADLLLQLPEWDHAVPSLCQSLGPRVETLSALLEFLTVLPEEAAENGRIDATNSDILTLDSAEAVVALLTSYATAPSCAPAVRKQCMTCLASWLRAGGLPARIVARTPLLDLAFQMLASDDQYDEAADLLVDLIHETQEIEDNFETIQLLMPRLIELRPAIAPHPDADPERVKAHGRVLAEAAEWYVPLVVRHPVEFLPLVEALADVARASDLATVRLTSTFWYRLSHARPEPSSAIVDVFVQVFDVIVGHLAFPATDAEPLTGEELDEFRQFRHEIGDTLKDCCLVLGSQRCLQRAYDLLSTAASSGSWQMVEAPLFAMRSIGAEIEPQESAVVPLIMAAIPNLPAHPKIRYAGILVVSRYTAWIDAHPDHIPATLSFISAGFADADNEVWLAAAQAMKWLCKDCRMVRRRRRDRLTRQHLIPYLPQLHAFVEDVGPKLPPDDLAEVTQGIAHIISAMSPDAALQALPMFCLPLVEQLHAFAQEPAEAGKAQIQAANDRLERLDHFLETCVSSVENLPESCGKTAADVYGVIDALLSRYGHVVSLAERTCAVIRRGLDFFGPRLVAPLAPAIIARMASSFATTGRSSYVWITGKMVKWAKEQAAAEAALKSAFESESAKIFALLPTAPLDRNQDGAAARIDRG